MKTNYLPSTFSAGKQTGRGSDNALQAATPSWQKHLPNSWHDAVEAPLHIKKYIEYEMSAEHAVGYVGYDADDNPCFISHHSQLSTLAPDDSNGIYEPVTHSEEMASWRLRDERWLVFHLSSTNGNLPRGFYAFNPEMPR